MDRAVNESLKITKPDRPTRRRSALTERKA
jgi:hypothetical protein